jgi:hypothetical protein
LVSQGNRAPQGLDDLQGDSARILLFLKIREQHAKLVGAQSGRRIRLTQTSAEQVRRELQQIVARPVSKAVVDQLEIVEVQV